MISGATRKLFWSRALGEHRDEDAVAWTLEEIAASPGTPSLAALATLTSPYNHFEVEDLLVHAFAELGIAEPDPQVSYREFMYEMGSAILEGRLSARDGCARLAKAHGGDIARVELQPFWLLDLGIRDLEGGAPQFYCPELTAENFDKLVRREARVLVEKSGAMA